MPPTLDEIGLKFGTDKASSHHNYLNFYDSFFGPLRQESLTLLEIGVFQGASLYTWREYFPNAKIIGVDIQLTCKRLESEQIKIELADQSNLEHLAQLAAKHGPFDIIVEDGSHMWEHQITTLRALFPFVKNGGYYVVEDLQTNFGALRAQYQGVASESCVEFLKRWTDLYVADDLIEIKAIEDPFLRTYGRSIDFINFHRRACVIRKRYPPTDWRVSQGPPLLSPQADALALVVNAHFGLRGDIFGPIGWVDEGADTFTIQGFALESETGGVEYRVRFPDGTWSDWVGEGKFAGTRGQALPVTGFSARMVERLRDRYDVMMCGKFVGGARVEKSAGEDCVASFGAELRGLQVIVRPAAPRPAAPISDVAASVSPPPKSAPVSPTAVAEAPPSLPPPEAATAEPIPTVSVDVAPTPPVAPAPAAAPVSQIPPAPPGAAPLAAAEKVVV